MNPPVAAPRLSRAAAEHINPRWKWLHGAFLGLRRNPSHAQARRELLIVAPRDLEPSYITRIS